MEMFKKCLGALVRAYIKVNVLEVDKPGYRTRKREIATNVLGVCSQELQFIYILPGWEGYTNGDGFLVPYRGQYYHLNEWRQNNHPQSKEELFNYKHSSARNAIERCNGLLKMRWAILRGRAWYPVKTHCQIISACELLHNYIRREMTLDPLEAELDESYMDFKPFANAQSIQYIETSNAWTTFRDNLAQEMWNEWQASRNQP
ncbi:uncharacterized protein LOC120284002 [Dioscorea cayenensis subsp. rotundata]|uniref:Uncharacterized protein LOC120284002 n=1 Tax=Dioscorea cayennensis subsp. rotundata TaxID=55577 RepID=A0AB40D355_DIOCR|nr:uncharacterized protein LOC120284002 [Dioscorea cayenensis subsp. rotundata]